MATNSGIDYLLIMIGDGRPGLEKLDPSATGGQHSVVTTPNVLNYIQSK